MSEAGEAVGGAFDGASELKHAQRSRNVECSGEDQRRDRALLRVCGVLCVDQVNDGGKRILGIGAVPLWNLDRGGEAGCRSLGCLHGDGAQFGKRRGKRSADPGWRQRSHKGGLLELVDGLLDPIDQLLDDRLCVEANDFLARLDGDQIGLLLDMAGTLGQPLAVRRPAGAKRCDMPADVGGNVVRQPDLAQHDRKQGAVDAFEVSHQVGFDLVARKPRRSPRNASVE